MKTYALNPPPTNQTPPRKATGWDPVKYDHLTYLVPSRSRRDPHLVDLQAYGNNGKCSCENFIFTMEPKLRCGAAPSRVLECWHIKLAKWFYAQEKLAEEIKAWGYDKNNYDVGA